MMSIGRVRARFKRRRFAGVATVVALLAAATLAFATSSESSSQNNRLFAYVVATNRGPLPACLQDGSNCTPTNTVWHFIHVVNGNQLTNLNGGTSRATMPNSFVVTSVDVTIFVNGVETFDPYSLTPPPNAFLRSYSGHWPATVTCAPGTPPPCGLVGDPAVIPGENTAITYSGWIHGDEEPNGTYVFRYTLHGTLNGDPVDLTASSPPIQMTD
jgi:hypothetical protein